ncbi:MAG: rod shape-determining protein MreD [Hyphomicrobiales bacterium]|nr:rod shape-determining protein MreD [Hyphomicrobiales bacterium]
MRYRFSESGLLSESVFILPGLFLPVGILLSTTYFPLYGFAEVMPQLVALFVGYWSLCWPRLIPSWLVLVMGLWLDVLSGLPVGVNALLLVGLRMLVVSQRRLLSREPFLSVWLAMAAALLLYHLLQWLVLSGLNRFPYPVLPVVVQWLLTVLCYPCIHAMSDRLYRALLKRF